MRIIMILAGVLMANVIVAATAPQQPVGLPPVPVPADNPQTPEKIALGDKLFNDKRFSSTGEVACATCHEAEKAFTDSPLSVSEGINKLTGTRNAPTVVNAAYNKTQFWDGRSPDLEDQALHPFLNPVEMALPNHDALIAIVRADEDYVKAFKNVFDAQASDITMTEVTRAIAAFERTQVAGNSPFDRWYFAGEADAMSESAQRGFDVFLADGRCISCHVIEQDQAVFTDHRFHNIGVGINDMQDRVVEVATAFQREKLDNPDLDVDIEALTDANVSELGRFAISDELSDVGAFKTPTLRNIAKTAPYMHDGSIETLRDVVTHYNNGGVTNEGDPVNAFISGGIKPLDLTDEQIDDLVAFMEALTSPEYEAPPLAMNEAAMNEVEMSSVARNDR
jgi:cytochrome c peroxidase